MHTQSLAGPLPCLEDCTRLVRIEGAVLAEDVDPAHMRRAALQHRAANELHIIVLSAGVLRRCHVGTQERHVIRERGCDATAAFLSLHVQAVARLDLVVGDAIAASATTTLLGQLSEVVIACGSRSRRRDPDTSGLVALAFHARGEFLRAVACEHEVSVAVDEAGDHRTPVGVDVPVTRGPAGVADLGHTAVLDHERGVSPDTQEPVLEAWVAGHELTDVVDDERGHGTVLSSSALTSMDACSPSRTIQLPLTITCRMSAEVAAKPTEGTRSSTRAPASPIESRPTTQRSAHAPTSSLPPFHPSASWPAAVAARSSAAGSWLTRCSLASRSFNSIARASSNMSMRAFESVPRHSDTPSSASADARPMPSARSRSVVGQKHELTLDAASILRSPSVRWVVWTAVKWVSRQPTSASTSTGVPPFTSRHSSFSRRCSDTCAWSGKPRARDHAAISLSSVGCTARTLWAAPPILTVWLAESCSTRTNQSSIDASAKRRCAPCGGSVNPPWR